MYSGKKENDGDPSVSACFDLYHTRWEEVVELKNVA